MVAHRYHGATSISPLKMIKTTTYGFGPCGMDHVMREGSRDRVGLPRPACVDTSEEGRLPMRCSLYGSAVLLLTLSVGVEAPSPICR